MPKMHCALRDSQSRLNLLKPAGNPSASTMQRNGRRGPLKYWHTDRQSHRCDIVVCIGKRPNKLRSPMTTHLIGALSQRGSCLGTGQTASLVLNTSFHALAPPLKTSRSQD
jgi:hypothetical protein